MINKNWGNLSKGTCINCDEILEEENGIVFCKYCSFRISLKKYMDLIKGKESQAYKAKVSRFKKIKKFKEKQKKQIKISNDIQNQERLSNLRRMLTKGLISQQEYDEKTKTNSSTEK